jgi:hypothetical protein
MSNHDTDSLEEPVIVQLVAIVEGIRSLTVLRPGDHMVPWSSVFGSYLGRYAFNRAHNES